MSSENYKVRYLLFIRCSLRIAGGSTLSQRVYSSKREKVVYLDFCRTLALRNLNKEADLLILTGNGTRRVILAGFTEGKFDCCVTAGAMLLLFVNTSAPYK